MFDENGEGNIAQDTLAVNSFLTRVSRLIQ